MIRAILFDFGGVIYKHPKSVIPIVLSKIYNQPEAKILAEYGKHKDSFFLGQISGDKLISDLSTAYGSNKSVPEIKRLWEKNYSKLAVPEIKVLELIKKLRKNYKLYLFSNTTELSNLHNYKTGIYELFDGKFFSFQMGLKKPDLQVYQKVLDAIGFQANECVLIDDREENLKPARQLGIQAILFDVLKMPIEQLIEELSKINVVTR